MHFCITIVPYSDFHIKIKSNKSFTLSLYNETLYNNTSLVDIYSPIIANAMVSPTLFSHCEVLTASHLAMKLILVSLSKVYRRRSSRFHFIFRLLQLPENQQLQCSFVSCCLIKMQPKDIDVSSKPNIASHCCQFIIVIVVVSMHSLLTVAHSNQHFIA